MMQLQESPSVAALPLATDESTTNAITSQQVAASLLRNVFTPPLAPQVVDCSGRRCSYLHNMRFGA